MLGGWEWLPAQREAVTVERVVYQGAKHLSEDDLNELTGIRTGTPLDPVANKAACRKIEQRYNEDGRPLAHCDLLKGGTPGDTEVVFNITEGPKVKVSAILFEGNTFVSGPVLATLINSSRAILGVGGTYNRAMTEADVHELEKYYRSFGFQDVRVALERQWCPETGSVALVFHIREGERRRVRDMSHEALEGPCKVKAGDYFSTEVTGAEVCPQGGRGHAKDEPGLMEVRYEIEEQPSARIPLKPGAVLHYPDRRTAEMNLTRLSIFVDPEGKVRATVTVLEPAGASPVKGVSAPVREGQTGAKATAPPR
jgi:hypothetical protein